jgi:hypothetical protein
MLLYVTERSIGILSPDFHGENFMTPSNLRKSLQRFGKWGALALGFGGLFAADASAERSELQSFAPGVPSSQHRNVNDGTVLVRLEGGTILVAEHGGAFEPLILKESRQVEELRRLLSEFGASTQSLSVPIGAMIVANGGAAGDASKPKAPDTDNGSGKKKQPSTKTKQPATNDSGKPK